MPRPLNDLQCPYKGCKYPGGTLYLKPFYRSTKQGVKVHHYWVVEHAKPDRKGDYRSITHYIGKKLTGKLKKLAESRG
jgi:hypothetical protein